MKKLNYRGVIFDAFSFANENCDKYIDESNAETLISYEYGGWGYICPQCIKKYELYKETDLTCKEVEEIIKSELTDDLICCINGCYNKNAYDINFKTEDCKLI